MPRCKGENVGADSVAGGERQLLANSSGRILAYAVEGDGLGEPVFVLSPKAQAEDDGVLLSVVLDPGTDASFLLVLDAATLE